MDIYIDLCCCISMDLRGSMGQDFNMGSCGIADYSYMLFFSTLSSPDHPLFIALKLFCFLLSSLLTQYLHIILAHNAVGHMVGETFGVFRFCPTQRLTNLWSKLNTAEKNCNSTWSPLHLWLNLHHNQPEELANGEK